MKRRVLTIFMALTFVFSLCACASDATNIGSNDVDDTSDGTSNDASSTEWSSIYTHRQQEIPFTEWNFHNMLGLDKLIQIDGYDSSTGTITKWLRRDGLTSRNCDYDFTNNGYIVKYRIQYRDGEGYIDDNVDSTYTCSIINNELLTYKGDFAHSTANEKTLQIKDIVKFSNENVIIIKMLESGGSARWFIPAAMVDWSVAPEETETKESWYVKCKMKTKSAEPYYEWIV